MRVLTIRQPWAWLIVHGGKDVENRKWLTKHRGRFLVHAGKSMTRREYIGVEAWCERRGLTKPPAFEQLQRGGIVGVVELVDCQRHSASPWYMGCVAFSLANPVALPFTPCAGKLGFFDAPADVLEKLEGLL